MTETIAELRPSMIRRVLACGVLVVIGAMFCWGGARDGDAPSWRGR